MKQGQNNRRQRSGRGSGGGGGAGGRRPYNAGHSNRSLESSGPHIKLRGSANQIWDKYLALARDASSSGDRIAAENYYQHAEHYYRLMTADTQNNNKPEQGSSDPLVVATPGENNNGARPREGANGAPAPDRGNDTPLKANEPRPVAREGANGAPAAPDRGNDTPLKANEPRPVESDREDGKTPLS